MQENQLTDNIINILNQHSNISLRFIEQDFIPIVLFLVVDKKECLVVEIIDDSKDSFIEKIGSYMHSTSKAAVLSYIAVFENMWTNLDTYQSIRTHNRIQEEFINMTAHELRTPIQPILFLTDILLNKIKDKEQLEILDIINRNANRLQRLADDVLDVTRIEAQSLKLEKEKFNLNNLIYDIISDYKNNNEKELDYNNIEISLYDRQQTFFVEADKERITQVILNLLGNAVKFTKDGKINIVLEQIDNNQVQVSIKDTGTGIDTDILALLFTKFASKSDSGTGLGLFISKSIIEAHGGRIWAKNNEDRRGATFAFIIPVLEKSERIADLLKDKAKSKILVVDDNSNFTYELKEELENNGYYVDSFTDPKKALENFMGGFYSLVVLDIEMPGINGFDLCQEIRKKDGRVKVCFLSAGGTHYEALSELYNISDNEQFIRKTSGMHKIIEKINSITKSDLKVR